MEDNVIDQKMEENSTNVIPIRSVLDIDEYFFNLRAAVDYNIESTLFDSNASPTTRAKFEWQRKQLFSLLKLYETEAIENCKNNPTREPIEGTLFVLDRTEDEWAACTLLHVKDVILDKQEQETICACLKSKPASPDQVAIVSNDTRDVHRGLLVAITNQIAQYVRNNEFKAPLYLCLCPLEHKYSFNPLDCPASSNSVTQITKLTCIDSASAIPLSFQCIPILDNLNTIKIQFSKTVPKQFPALPNLTVLDLSDNQMKEIDEQFFSNCPALQQISLAHNQLRLIPENTFKILGSLKSLNLSNNLLSDVSWLPSGIDWPRERGDVLETLDLSQNPITQFPERLFVQRYYRLKRLFLTAPDQDAQVDGVFKQIQAFFWGTDPTMHIHNHITIDTYDFFGDTWRRFATPQAHLSESDTVRYIIVSHPSRPVPCNKSTDPNLKLAYWYLQGYD